jgi:hypothetical protein
MQIRYAARADLEQLIDFLRMNWSSDHVFVKNPELLLWQHGQPDSEILNFVVGEVDGRLCSILGFIPSTRFDPNMDVLNISLAIWAKSQNAPAGSGALLLKYLEKRNSINSIFAIGLSTVVKPIYKALGYEVSEMKHYAVINSKNKEFKLLKSGGEVFLKQPLMERNVQNWIREVVSTDELQSYFGGIKTFKTFQYIKTRYINHPAYKYKFAILGSGKKNEAIVIFRIQTHNSKNALRLVDLLGSIDDLSKYLITFQTLLTNFDAEYIHFYTSGEIAIKPGEDWVLQITNSSETIVPNYFEPFSSENVVLDYCIKCMIPKGNNLVIYLGDSDQDRPNIAGIMKGNS